MSPIRFITALLLPVLAVPALAESWATLSGKVLDPSGAAVAEAVVVLNARDAQSQRSERTSAEGEFRFISLPEGEYLLTARAPVSALPIRRR